MSQDKTSCVVELYSLKDNILAITFEVSVDACSKAISYLILHKVDTYFAVSHGKVAVTYVDEDGDTVILNDKDSYKEAVKLMRKQSKLIIYVDGSLKDNTQLANTHKNVTMTVQSPVNAKDKKSSAAMTKLCSICRLPVISSTQSYYFVCMKNKCKSSAFCSNCVSVHSGSHAMLRVTGDLRRDLVKSFNATQTFFDALEKGTRKKQQPFKVVSKQSNIDSSFLHICWRIKTVGRKREDNLKLQFVGSALEPVTPVVLVPGVVDKKTFKVHCSLKLDKQAILSACKTNDQKVGGSTFFVESDWQLIRDADVPEVLLSLHDSTPVMLLVIEKEAEATEENQDWRPLKMPRVHQQEVVPDQLHSLSHDSFEIIEKHVAETNGKEVSNEDCSMQNAEEYVKAFSAASVNLATRTAAEENRLGSTDSDSLMSLKSSFDAAKPSSVVDDSLAGQENNSDHAEDNDFADMYQSALLEHENSTDATTMDDNVSYIIDQGSICSQSSLDDSDVEILNVSNDNECLAHDFLITDNANPTDSEDDDAEMLIRTGDATPPPPSTTTAVIDCVVTAVEDCVVDDLPVVEEEREPSVTVVADEFAEAAAVSTTNLIYCQEVGQEAMQEDALYDSQEGGDAMTEQFPSSNDSNIYEHNVEEQFQQPDRSSINNHGNNNDKFAEFMSKMLRSLSLAFENVTASSSQAFATVNDALEILQTASSHQQDEPPLPKPIITKKNNGVATTPSNGGDGCFVLSHQAWVPKGTQTSWDGEVSQQAAENSVETLSKSEKDLCDFVRKSRQLKDLGFDDDARNAQLLIQFNGDLNKVIDAILNV